MYHITYSVTKLNYQDKLLAGKFNCFIGIKNHAYLTNGERTNSLVLELETKKILQGLGLVQVTATERWSWVVPQTTWTYKFGGAWHQPKKKEVAGEGQTQYPIPHV